MSQHKKSTASRNDKIVSSITRTIKMLLTPLGHAKRETMLSILAEKLIPVTSISTPSNHTLKFWGFGGWPLYRGRSVLDKEPLTIKWIDGFTPKCVFWDIGANVGVYSIYAAATKRAQTYSFEPSLANIAVLAKNVEMNTLADNISAFPIALSDKSGIDYLNMISTAPGNTGGQFSSHDTQSVLKQACLGFSIDDFIERYKLDVPNYIKIDVDGIENLILKGAEKTLQNPAIKSIILEANINGQDYTDIYSLLVKNHGFKETESEATVKGREHMRNIIFEKSS